MLDLRLDHADVRPLRAEDVAAAHALAQRTFAELDRGAEPRAPDTPENRARGQARIAHLLEHDPGGAWVAAADDRILGVVLALVREQLWALSLLAVDPEAQGAGLGRKLLARALAYGGDRPLGMILSSDDPHALRSYAGAGFELRPCFEARGPLRHAQLPPRCGRVRAGGPEDLELAATVAREQRGAAHGPDLEQLLAWEDQRLLVVPEAGFAVFRDSDLRLLAARDKDAARALLVAVLRKFPEGQAFALRYITGGQQWAIELALAAGLELRPSGSLCVRGASGPTATYVPNSRYL